MLDRGRNGGFSGALPRMSATSVPRRSRPEGPLGGVRSAFARQQESEVEVGGGGPNVRRNAQKIWPMLLLMFMAGCATVKMSGLERASDPIVEEKYRARGWCGCDWGRKWNEEKSSNRTIGSVLVYYDYVDALLAVLSFGLYMPIEVGYRLNPEGVEGGVEVR